MMNNFEKIKNMTVDEMAEFLKTTASTFLVLKVNSSWINKDGIKQWLQAESEVENDNQI